MEIIVSRKAMLPALERCAAIANTKSPMAILGSSILRTSGGVLTFTANDLTRAIKCNEADVEVKADGVVAINAKELAARVRMLPEGSVSLTLNKTVLTIKSGKIRYTMAVVDADQAPDHPKGDADASFTMPAAELAQRIAHVLPFASSDSSRAVIFGVHMVAKGGALHFEATDGHSAIIDISKRDGAFDLFIPRSGAEAIAKLCASAEGDAVISVNASWMFVRVGEVELAAALTSETFPEVQRLIPEKSKHTVTIDRATLVSTVRAVAVAADREVFNQTECKTPRLLLTSDGAELLVSTDGDRGTAAASVPDAEGKLPEVHVNARLLMNALSAFDGAKLAIEHDGKVGPIVFRCEGDESVCCVMPMSS